MKIHNKWAKVLIEAFKSGRDLVEENQAWRMELREGMLILNRKRKGNEGGFYLTVAEVSDITVAEIEGLWYLCIDSNDGSSYRVEIRWQDTAAELMEDEFTYSM